MLLLEWLEDRRLLASFLVNLVFRNPLYTARSGERRRFARVRLEDAVGVARGSWRARGSPIVAGVVADVK